MLGTCQRTVSQGRVLFLLCWIVSVSPYAKSAAVLEEVVVTAQLREQSLQDVPVSVSAISGDKMMEAGLARIEGLCPQFHHV